MDLALCSTLPCGLMKRRKWDLRHGEAALETSGGNERRPWIQQIFLFLSAFNGGHGYHICTSVVKKSLVVGVLSKSV